MNNFQFLNEGTRFLVLAVLWVMGSDSFTLIQLDLSVEERFVDEI